MADEVIVVVVDVGVFTIVQERIDLFLLCDHVLDCIAFVTATVDSERGGDPSCGRPGPVCPRARGVGFPGSRKGPARGGDLPVCRGPCWGVVLGVAPGPGTALAAEERQPHDVSYQTVGVRVVEVSGRMVSAERSSSPRLGVTPSEIPHNLQE